MRAVLQRVLRAAVRAEDGPTGAIEGGLLVLVAVERGDQEADARVLARKIAALRCFPGRTPMDRTLSESGGSCLLVSQFTLAADLLSGNRPGLDRAEAPERARALLGDLAACLRREGLSVQTGRFGARMEVELVNDGPVTFILATAGGRLVPLGPAKDPR